MNDSLLRDNMTLGDRILQLKPAAAAQSTQMFLENHPDWLLKYGDKAWLSVVEDAQHPIDFLAGALEADSPQVFQDYCAWASSFMESRGMAARFLAECLTEIETSLCSQLSTAEQTIVLQFIKAGRAGCDREQTAWGELDSSVLQSGPPPPDRTKERD